jgi:hypothetical protein
MIKRLFFLFFLSSCIASNTNTSDNKESLDFNDDLTFKEFNELLIKYAMTKPYPNIDQ